MTALVVSVLAVVVEVDVIIVVVVVVIQAPVGIWTLWILAPNQVSYYRALDRLSHNPFVQASIWFTLPGAVVFAASLCIVVTARLRKRAATATIASAIARS